MNTLDKLSEKMMIRMHPDMRSALRAAAEEAAAREKRAISEAEIARRAIEAFFASSNSTVSKGN